MISPDEEIKDRNTVYNINLTNWNSIKLEEFQQQVYKKENDWRINKYIKKDEEL